MRSATAVVKAITSCFTSFSISRMRATSKPACWRSSRAASAGTTPSEASASEAASSTSSHCWNLFWSVQIPPISGRVYLGIISSELKDRRRSVLRCDRKPGAQAAAIQRLRGHHVHDGRMIVLFAEVAQHQLASGGIQILLQVIRHHQVREMPHPAHHALLHRPGIRPHLDFIDLESPY